MNQEIILNERKYAEQCIENKPISDKPYFTLSILARYYYHICGFRKKRIAELLKQYIEQCYPKYLSNKSIWDETVEKIAMKAGKFKLQELDGVWITSKELEAISSLHSKVLEKLAFTILCLSKLNYAKNPDNDFWCNVDAKQIFKMARVADSADDRYSRLYKLKEAGLIEPSRKIAELSFRVTFAEPCGENKLFVKESDFSELGYKYLQHIGENITECQECGTLIRNNIRHTRKYCTNCAGYTPQETKMITCVDCGKDFDVDSKNNKTKRCDSCQTKHVKIYDRLRKAKIPFSNLKIDF